MRARLARWAARLKSDVIALWFCCRHRQTPWYAKLVATIVVAYALSPIDLIPDFIPVLGYLDDLLLVPLGLWLAIALVPPAVLAACRTEAEAWLAQNRARPRSIAAAVAIALIWAIVLTLAIVVAWRHLAED